VSTRRLAAAAALAIAVPALAYLLPVSAILRRVAERRASLQLVSLEVTGTFQAEGAAAERLAPATGVEARGGQLTVPARFSLKVPGRCRLELVPPEASEAERPFVAVHDARTAGARGLNGTPAAVALVRTACALLAVSPSGGGDAYAAALGRRGVALADATLGRFDGRIAYVIGGREKSDRPLAYVDKEAFQPMRLVSAEGGTAYDVRLLGWGSPTGGDWFPRAIEVWEKDQLRVRFTTERPTPNPKIGDALFP
jgi:hypothetical protein